MEKGARQSRWRVFSAVEFERAFQDHRWGGLSEHPHTVGEWLLILESELEEAKNGWVRVDGDRQALEEVLQVVAVGVACLEQHGLRIPNDLKRAEFVVGVANEEFSPVDHESSNFHRDGTKCRMIAEAQVQYLASVLGMDAHSGFSEAMTVLRERLKSCPSPSDKFKTRARN